MRGGRRDTTFDWTEARVARLKAIAADGLPASVAAAEFGITRNAAIGKAIRIGCRFRSQVRTGTRDAARPGKAAPARAKASAAPKPARGKQPVTRPDGPRGQVPAEAPKVAPPAPVHAAAPPASHVGGKPVRFADVEAGQCKWPVGDAAPGPDMPVCGCPTSVSAGIGRDDDYGEGHGLTWKRRFASLGLSFCPDHLRMAGGGS